MGNHYCDGSDVAYNGTEYGRFILFYILGSTYTFYGSLFKTNCLKVICLIKK